MGGMRQAFAVACVVMGLATALPGGVSARPAASAALAARPIGSPADWLSPNDYPVDALRNDMEGVTSFRLAVDAAGRPIACDVTGSSGFDVLDRAACERLMANARFTPAHDAQGKAIPGSYANRVRWTRPANANDFIPFIATMQLKVDPAGKIADCAMIASDLTSDKDSPCRGIRAMPAEIARIMRGATGAGTGEVSLELGAGYGEGPPPTMLGETAGYDRRALFISRFTINAEGRMSTCRMTEQRGEAALVQNFCLANAYTRFDPPFALIGPDGTVSGWSFGRILARREP